ncbi:MAG TPA: hypothetical protein VFR40_10965 [Lapillicoccus sp.]|nr:hypothetical protein [Lapillicoccus sp.]
MSTNETDGRSGMERRATDEDRARLRADEQRTDQERADDERAEQERTDHERAEHERAPEGTRPMRTDETREYASHDDDGRAGYAGTGQPAYVEEPRVVAGSARGRLHVGINWGAAFFGWMAAVGLAVILTAFVAAVGAAVGVTQGADTIEEATTQLGNQDPQTVGIVGVILLAVIAFVSYYGGGYVAARMSRFDGARQGFAVWLWAIVVAVVVAIVAAVAGARFDVLSTLNSFPRLPVGQGDLTFTGILALVLLLVITLLGAVLGGAAGMRYHRKLETAEAEYLQ